MRIVRWLFVATLLFAGTASAQIYRCTAPDGTPVFSDERCGPDAKVVTGITTGKRASPAASRAAPVQPRSAEELQALLEQCNAGDTAACMTWTKAGGTRQLKEEEARQAAACEEGSLSACEQRYCSDGVTDECRRRVQQAASVAGSTWYLREHRRGPGDAAEYAVRCISGHRARDVTVRCAVVAGPERCAADHLTQAYARLDQAAHAACEVASLR